jgi:hypothetical protein
MISVRSHAVYLSNLQTEGKDRERSVKLDLWFHCIIPTTEIPGRRRGE